MRIEINAGGLGDGAAVAEYQWNMSGFISDAESVISSFKAVNSKAYDLNGGVGSLQGAVDAISERIQQEEERKEAAVTVQKKSNDFLGLAIRVDKQVATLVDQNRDEFYKTNPWLKPAVAVDDTPWYQDVWYWLCDMGEGIAEGAEAVWEWTKDTAKKAWDGLVEFYNEHKKIIDTVLIVVGAIVAIAAVVASGGGALIPLLMAFGCSAGVAAVISGAVAVVAVISTVAASTLNVIDIWAEIEDSTFQVWKKGLNIISGVSNLTYSIGTFYNSFHQITPEQAQSAMKAATAGTRGEWVHLDNGQNIWVDFACDLGNNQGADVGINRFLLTDNDPGIFYSVKNQSGGKVYVSVNPSQADGMDIVNLVDQMDGHVNILSGTHGDQLGQLAREHSFYQLDYQHFSTYPNVDVYDIFSLSPSQIKMIVNSPGSTVCAWCYSERSKVILSALGLI